MNSEHSEDSINSDEENFDKLNFSAKAPGKILYGLDALLVHKDAGYLVRKPIKAGAFNVKPPIYD